MHGLSVRMMRVVGATIAVMLAGCEGSATVELATKAPTDPTVDQVLVDLDGVQFRKDDGGTETLQFKDPVRVDLMDYVAGSAFRLFTDEQLPDGRYTGARLTFASDDKEDDTVALTDGRQFDLTATSGDFTSVDFTINKDDSTREDVILTLDLRQSLRFDDNNRTFSLAPLLRAVRSKDAGTISGTVTADCPGGRLLTGGAAVYLFAGEDVTPNDRGSAADPYLTTAVGTGTSGGGFGYTISYVPEGDYTIVLSCRADEEDPITDDDLSFRNPRNVSVRAGETLTHNIAD